METTKKEFNHTLHSTNHSKKSNYMVEYKEQKLEYIISIPESNKKDDASNPFLNRLVKSKGNIPLFRDMEDADIINLISVFKFSTYEPGEIIIKRGEISTNIFFIISGSCSVIVNKATVGTLKKYQIFGEFAFLLQQPRSATIKTTEETIIIKFKFDEKLFHKYPFSFYMLYKNITEELIKKIININKIRI